MARKARACSAIQETRICKLGPEGRKSGKLIPRSNIDVKDFTVSWPGRYPDTS